MRRPTATSNSQRGGRLSSSSRSSRSRQLPRRVRQMGPCGRTFRRPARALPPVSVALTVAVVAASVGIAFGASANTAQDQLHARLHTQAAAQQLYDTANARAAAANSFSAGAAVAGATAVTLFFLEPSLGQSP